jgi:ParB/RepB/Spo0J family partition protein
MSSRSDRQRISSYIREFDADRVRPLVGQPRKRFAGIKELANSMRAIGQITPGLVTLVEDDDRFDAELVDGERRLKACALADLPFQAQVRPRDDADKIFAISFAANFGRQGHDPVEIAEALDRMRSAGRTNLEIAAIAGKSDFWVSTHLRLLGLRPEVLNRMVPGDDNKAKLSMDHAMRMFDLPEPQQLGLLKKIDKGISSKALRLEVDRLRRRLELPVRGEKSRSIGKLGKRAKHFLALLGNYLDLEGDEFNKLVDYSSSSDARCCVDDLEAAADALWGLRRAISRRKGIKS